MTPPLSPDQRAARSASWRRGQEFQNAYLAASAVVLVVLIVIVVYVVFRVSAVANANRANAITACQDANANRTEDTTLFQELLVLPPDPTAAQRAQITRDLALVHKAYALRNCTALYSTGG
jgi:hypothetical protein